MTMLVDKKYSLHLDDWVKQWMAQLGERRGTRKEQEAGQGENEGRGDTG